MLPRINTLSLSILLSLLSIGCNIERVTREVCLQSAVTITSVGGCDRTGYCGVMLSDGSIHAHTLPVVGEIVYRSFTDRRYLSSSCP